MRNIVVNCPFDVFTVTIPAQGMVDLWDYCPCRACGARGECIFAPFAAEDAPDMIW